MSDDKIKTLQQMYLDDGINEISTTMAVGGYNTPNVFSELGINIEFLEKMGYTIIKKKNNNASESRFKTISNELFLSKSANNNLDTINEASYMDYKNNQDLSSKQKVNNSILEINKQLKLIETTLKHNLKLKQELNINNSQYWKKTKVGLHTINKRLHIISKYIRDITLN